MPRLKVSAARSGALAPLINSDKKVVENLKPRNKPTRGSVRPFNVRACGTKISNVKT